LTLQASLPGAGGEEHATHAIEMISETYRKAVLAGDAAAVAATYDPGAIEMPPCRPPLKGRTAIEQYYRELFNQPMRITNFAFAKTETATAGNIGYTTGAYKRTILSQSGDRLEDSGNFVAILKRASGVWKSIYVIYNSEHPPASTNNPTQAIGSPFPALMNYYGAVASEWLFRFGLLFLGCVCLGLIVSGVRSFLRRGRSGWQHHGSQLPPPLRTE
jgi:uncharacterized protein (TIGR02246 family)